MIRTIKIWWLLRKLYACCHDEDEKHADHLDHAGHTFRPMVREADFLKEVSDGGAFKLAKYGGYLSIADNKMKLLKSHEHTEKCQNCGCSKGPSRRCISLNEDGIEFATGVVDLIEYILIKYKLTWTLIIAPIVALLIGLKIG